MVFALDQLPDDIETLKRLLIGREELIASLMAEITRLKRWRFGRSSEQADAALSQLGLALEELQSKHEATRTAEPEQRIASQDSKQRDSTDTARGKRHAKPRGALPEHLPRETLVHEPASCACPDCGQRMRRLGEDVAEQLDYVPGYFRVLRHVRPKLSCGRCSRVIQLAAPSRPIERGLPTPALLAHVLVSKYGDHCPLYRQQAIYRRVGVDLDRGLLAEWVGAAARLLDPLVDVLGRYVLAAEKVHADDTPVPVLDPGRGKTKTGRLWAYVRDDRAAASRAPPAVWYRYSPDRKGEHPAVHLRAYCGILQADGYAGFGALYDGGQIVEAACWAHARRKFYDIWAADRSPLAAEAIGRIGALYAIERELRGQAPPLRAAARQRSAVPLCDELHAWLSRTLQSVSAKSQLAAAIRYALVRWPALTRYCSDGRIEIDNNTAERALRGAVLGRKNYLFAGSDAGGERAAAIYSLIGTALLNDMDPHAYLHHVLERIAEHPINRIGELVPWCVAATQAPDLRTAA
jgi:transposase